MSVKALSMKTMSITAFIFELMNSNGNQTRGGMDSESSALLYSSFLLQKKIAILLNKLSRMSDFKYYIL